MEIHQIKDRAFEANLYLIEGDRTVLVDAGTGMDVGNIVKSLERFVSLSSIDKIILTHRHYDHTGGAAELQRVTNAKVLASVDDAPPVANGDRSVGSWMFGQRFEPPEVEVLRYGERIDLGGCELEALHTPGHTIGSISLYDRKSGTIFTGDLVFAYGSVGRWDLATGNFKQLLESLKMVAGLNIKNLYPGHGPYVEGEGSEHLRMALEYLGYEDSEARYR